MIRQLYGVSPEARAADQMLHSALSYEPLASHAPMQVEPGVFRGRVMRGLVVVCETLPQPDAFGAEYDAQHCAWWMRMQGD